MKKISINLSREEAVNLAYRCIYADRWCKTTPGNGFSVSFTYKEKDMCFVEERLKEIRDAINTRTRHSLIKKKAEIEIDIRSQYDSSRLDGTDRAKYFQHFIET